MSFFGRIFRLVWGTEVDRSLRPVLAVSFVGSVAGYGLLSLGRNRQILVLALAGLLTAIVLMSILIPLLGARGAALGTMISEIAFAGIGWTVLSAGRPELRPPLRIVPRVAFAAAAGCAPLLLGSWPLLARLVLSTALYAAVVLATRAFPAELLDLLPERLRARFAGR